jgi:hypothetical protein
VEYCVLGRRSLRAKNSSTCHPQDPCFSSTYSLSKAHLGLVDLFERRKCFSFAHHTLRYFIYFSRSAETRSDKSYIKLSLSTIYMLALA